MPEEKVEVVKEERKLPKNFGDRVTAYAFLQALIGVVMLVVSLILHSVLVPDPHHPHADPGIVTFFLGFGAAALATALLILVGKIATFLIRVVAGKEELI